MSDAGEHARRLAGLLGHDFARPERLARALTHPGAADAAQQRRDYERLEFLGDRVVGLVVADLLLETFPRESEGHIARRHAALVSAAAMVRVAEGLDLAPYLTLPAEGERDGMLADAMEAVIAALYLDGGLDAARPVVERLWRPLMAADVQPPKDAKTALQEWAQRRGLPLPSYTETAREGPPHAPVFSIAAAVEGHEPAAGSGTSKRAAEQMAAQALLDRLRDAND